MRCEYAINVPSKPLLQSICYRHVIDVPQICDRLPRTVLSICSAPPVCYRDATDILSPCYQYTMTILCMHYQASLCYWYYVNTLSICCAYAVSKLSIFRQFRIVFLLMCYQYAIMMLCTCRRILLISSQYRISSFVTSECCVDTVSIWRHHSVNVSPRRSHRQYAVDIMPRCCRMNGALLPACCQ